MEKVGLITIHDTINYGSLLQTFSLYKALEKMGVDIELIDYKCAAIQKRETTYSPREWKKWKDVVFFFLSHRKMKKKRENYLLFLNNEMKLSPAYEKCNIAKANAFYSTFLVGSDIVWGMTITGEDFSYMLDFAAEDKRKLAFSASVGTKWKNELASKVKTLLSRFDTISVRERLASDWIKELLEKEDIPVTCDPTMLMEPGFWNQYLDDSIIPQSKYVLVYMSADNHQSVKDAILYAKTHSYKVLYIHHGLPYKGSTMIYPTRVQQWISLIKNAEVVFTGSYHGLLFSLYMHTNVFYYNRAYSARMKSLCDDFNIGYREALPDNIKADRKIDFESVDRILDKNRNYSLRILSCYFKHIDNEKNL